MANSLYPAFFRIFYRTAYAPHTMTIPVKAWNPVSGGHPSGTFTNHLDAEVDAEDMIDGLVLILKEIWLPSTNIANAIIYTMESATSPAVPRVTYTIDVDGVNTNTGWAEAVQLTFTLRTADFNKAKYVLLDVPSDNDFTKQTSQAALSGAFSDMIDYVEDSANAFVGRDGFQPTAFVSMIFDLNDGLRKRYRLA